MKTIELTENELDQANGAGINGGNGVIDPSPNFRFGRLRIVDPTES